MTGALKFLSKFIFVSIVAYVFWSPISWAHLSLLGSATDFAFWVTGHPARFEMTKGQPHIRYPGLSAPKSPNNDIRVPVYNSVAIHSNVIMLLALFGALPGMSRISRLRGISVGLALLFITHAMHVYFLTHLFIWVYLGQQADLPTVAQSEVIALALLVEQRFSPELHVYLEKVELYWNSFLRETAPIVIWLAYAASLEESFEAGSADWRRYLDRLTRPRPPT